MHVGLCRLQEMCWLRARECNIIIPSSIRGHQREGDLKLVWFGVDQWREQGVGLLMAST
jgi:hypothetical protein